MNNSTDLKLLKVLMSPEDKERILFLKSKVLNLKEDIIETGDIILTSLRRYCE